MRLFTLLLLIPLGGCASAMGDYTSVPRPPNAVVSGNQASIGIYSDELRCESEASAYQSAGLDSSLRRTVINSSDVPAGTIVIKTSECHLYLGIGGGQALRYGIGVGKEGFAWAGVEKISNKKEWPSWTPPDEMLARRPDLPRFVPGGPANPLGARALYLGSTLYRIHGSNEPYTIGHAVSSGCIRMTNDDVADLYNRVSVGTEVKVLP